MPARNEEAIKRLIEGHGLQQKSCPLTWRYPLHGSGRRADAGDEEIAQQLARSVTRYADAADADRRRPRWFGPRNHRERSNGKGHQPS